MMQLNTVKERVLFLSPVVQAGWERESNINDFEKLGGLGSGAFGVVSKMRHKKSGMIYAVKAMDKPKLKASGMIEQIKTEIKIMYSLSHENVIKLYNHFEDDNHVYLIIEFAAGGQLWEKLQKSEGKRIPEKLVAGYVKDLVSALEYLHGKGIVHRDIKPENLLIDSNGRLKVADFGWSNFFKQNITRTTFCGTLDYLAPEMVVQGHHHDHMVDIWAVGVLTYELLTGSSPFAPQNTFNIKDVERGTQENIRDVKFEFPKDFPSLAKDMVSKILKKNPRTRLSLTEIKSHPWVKGNTAFLKSTKKEYDTEAMIQEVTFGQTMADKNKIAKADKTAGNVDMTFTEDEIIQYAKPDSMLDKTKFDFKKAENKNIDLQLAGFKAQMDKINTKTNKDIAQSPGNSSANLYGLSPTQVKSGGSDLESQLFQKTEEITKLKLEIERMKAEKATNQILSGDTSKQLLESENNSLKAKIKDLEKRLNDKDSELARQFMERVSLEEKLKKSLNPLNIGGADPQVLQLKNEINSLKDSQLRDKLMYEAKISDLQSKTGGSGLSGGFGDSRKLSELEEQNKNLQSQVNEYMKLIKNLHGNDSAGGDLEKKRLLDDIKTLGTLNAIKQDRIDKLELKIKSGI